MGIDTKCFVCNNTIKNLNSDSTKIKKQHECKRFYGLVCRYLNCDLVQLSNIDHYNPTKTLRPSEKISGENTPVSCCDSCIPLIKSFSDTYNHWKIQQLVLNWKLETITKLMLIKSKFKNDADPHLPGEIFRSSFLKSVNDNSRCIPRLTLPKVKVPPPRPNPKVNVKLELIQSYPYCGSPGGSDFGADDNQDVLLDDNQEEEQDNETKDKAVAKVKPQPKKWAKCGRKSRKRPNHEYSHSGVKPYKCNLCGNRFSNKGNLQRHKESHHRNTVARHEHKCQFCDKHFIRKDTLVQHERVHTGQKSYKCGVCSKKFANPFSCKRHEANHIGKKLKPHKCNLCGNYFSQKDNLQRHKKFHHRNTSAEHKCQFCDKHFRYKCNLVQHKRIHTGVKPYSCGVCSKAFTSQSNWKRHEANHTGEKSKPFFCQYCDKKFAYKFACRRHEQSHNPSKPRNVLSSGKKKFKLKTERNDETLLTDSATNNHFEAIEVRIIKSENVTLEQTV